MSEIIEKDELSSRLPPEWQVVNGKPRAVFATDSFSVGADFVSRIAHVADDVNHHPDVVLTYPAVEVTTISHDVGAVTERDVALAQQISQVAQKLGIAAATN